MLGEIISQHGSKLATRAGVRTNKCRLKNRSLRPMKSGMGQLSFRCPGLIFAVRLRPRLSHVAIAFAPILSASSLLAYDIDSSGVSTLRREQPSLTGAGVAVGQSEGQEAPSQWEVDPSVVGQPASLFTWISSAGTATTFPNAVGAGSGHASLVGSVFYGTGVQGVAPGVRHVRNYDAGSYYSLVIVPKLAQADCVVNQSWIQPGDTNLQNNFDAYAATYNVLFVSGMNNATDTPPPPGSCYNGIGVGRPGFSSIGPTADGRSKPDIVVPEADGSLTSFLTPVVAGSATLLLQAAARGDGGSGTESLATNVSVIKAILLNGAVKPSAWTNGPTRPLDARWGAGMLNVYNSWLQLRGGRATANATNALLKGWDSTTMSASNADQTNRYTFDVAATSAGTVTLVWKRPVTGTLANFDLFLRSSNQVVGSSISTVDNVEHLFATNLPPGRYDLEVVRRGGMVPLGPQNYALAFSIVPKKLSIERSGANVVVSWPVNEAGFALQYTADVSAPVAWGALPQAPFVTNGLNRVVFPASGSAQFYRLAR